MDSRLGMLIYILVKYIAYAGWCYVGLRQLREAAAKGSAAGLGFLRLVLGVVFGVSVFLFGGMLHLDVPAHPYLLYLSIYAPIRYIEWSIMAFILLRNPARTASFASVRAQSWVVGGIFVSHLADLPMIVWSYGGAKAFPPIGRFLC